MVWNVTESRGSLTNTILWNRGYKTSAQQKEFYNPTWNSAYDIPDFEEALARIVDAAYNNKNILIFGDFDNDGVCSALIMREVILELSAGKEPYIFIPERAENHGLNPYAVRRFIRHHDVKLVITTDCGTGDASKVRQVQDWGCEVIVTDHHSSYAELAPCLNVNPSRHDSTYPTRVLSGSGVAQKFAQECMIGEKTLDLATLGTVADIMPLREENRRLVIDGLPKIAETSRVGLKALIKGTSTKVVDTQAISFYLAPRINSANRMASPQLSLELLMTSDAERAKELVSVLNNLNTQRQNLVSGWMDKIYPELHDDPPVALVVGDWPSGVNGLLASKVSEKLFVPAFVGTLNGDFITASARGVDGIHIDELLETAHKLVPDLFTNFGGHAGAGGFGMESRNLLVFWSILQEIVKPAVRPDTHIDAEIPITALTTDAVREIQKLAPFGAGFSEPVIASTVKVTGLIPLRGTKHNKILLDAPVDALLFFQEPDFRTGDTVRIAYNAQMDKYKGEEKPKLLIKSWEKQ